MIHSFIKGKRASEHMKTKKIFIEIMECFLIKPKRSFKFLQFFIERTVTKTVRGGKCDVENEIFIMLFNNNTQGE